MSEEEAKPLRYEDKKPKERDPEEGACTKCWHGYCACVVAIFKVKIIIIEK